MRILLPLLMGTLLSADDSFDGFIKNMKEKTQYKEQKSSENEAKEIQVKYNIPSRDEVISKNSELLNRLDSASKDIAQKSLKEQFNTQATKLKDLNISLKDEKVDTIFYLFSTSQSEYMFYNFVQDSTILKKINNKIKFYGVVQGVLSQEQLQKLYVPFKYHKNEEANAIIKMQPFIFKDLALDRVPAYLFSKCTRSEFKYKECENKYIIRGEISLQAALEVVSRNDKSYLKYFKLLKHGEK